MPLSTFHQLRVEMGEFVFSGVGGKSNLVFICVLPALLVERRPDARAQNVESLGER